MIAVSASMKEELSFCDNLNLIRKEHHGPFEFEILDFESSELIVSICGIGKVNAAAMAQTLILVYEPELIINIGTAGSINDEVKRKDVIIATETVQHDYNLQPFGFTRGKLVELDIIAIPCDEKFITIAKKYASEYRSHFGRALSGDQVVADTGLIREITDLFGGLSADMESAAFGQVCAMNKVPYAVIRGISDDSDDDRLSDFLENMGTVSETNGKLLLSILHDYLKS